MTDSKIYEQLLTIGKRVLAESDINQVLITAVDDALEIACAERGLIILFAGDGDISFQTARNLKKEEIENPEFEISRTIINEVKKTGKTLYFENAMGEQKLKKSRSATMLKLLSVMCLPLRYDDDIFGVLYLDNRTLQGAFTAEICQFVESFTDFISLAAHHALRQKQLMNHVNALEKELRGKYSLESIIGHHPKMVQILKLVSQVANTDATVFIQGESGTGKELIAQALHYNSSRKSKAFIPINCGALQENLLESELFGHVKGAFTGASADKAGLFERAHGGTIFLDEVSEMTPSLQVKLLRVLQSGEYFRVGSPEICSCNARIIAASNQNLHKLVMAGKFREDLYYRLNVINIELPPLRERKTDIPLLVQHFLNVYNAKTNRTVKCLSKKVETILQSYDFPGNVRELENGIQRAITLAEKDIIESHHLPEIMCHCYDISFSTQQPTSLTEFKRQAAERAEQEFIITCLEATEGHVSNAAKKAGINVSNFYKTMKKHGIDPHDFKPY
ncbi:MAG TPA: sigma-54-dependent Fis family transcriptional regulator [bacterium]